MDGNSSFEHIGGKLQFFKDGKFILELTRSKEGESFNWVSVPKKIKSATTIFAANSKHDGSLSCSDDNSSLQSSPWQRDHYWKQSNPKKEISKELCLYFCKHQKHYGNISPIYKNKNVLKLMSRRPFLREIEQVISSKLNLKNDTKTTQSKIKIQANPKINSNLSNVIERLTCIAEKKMQYCLLGKQNHITAKFIDAYNHTHISPRKRILREFEKVSLDDNKRSKSKYSSYGTKFETTNKINSKQTADDLSSQNKPQAAAASNFYTTMATQLSKTFTSYSINSLLANNNISSATSSSSKKYNSTTNLQQTNNSSISANQICESGFGSKPSTSSLSAAVAATSSTNKAYCQTTHSDSLKKSDMKTNDSINYDLKSNNINDCAFGEKSSKNNTANNNINNNNSNNNNKRDSSEKTVSIRQNNYEYVKSSSSLSSSSTLSSSTSAASSSLSTQPIATTISSLNNLNENLSAIRNLPMVTSTNSSSNSMFYLYPSAAPPPPPPPSSNSSYQIPTVPQTTNFYNHYSNAFSNLRNSNLNLINSNPWLSYPAIVAAAGILNPYFPSYSELTAAAGLAAEHNHNHHLQILHLREEIKNGENNIGFDKVTNSSEENDVPLNLSKH